MEDHSDNRACRLPQGCTARMACCRSVLQPALRVGAGKLPLDLKLNNAAAVEPPEASGFGAAERLCDGPRGPGNRRPRPRCATPAQPVARAVRGARRNRPAGSALVDLTRRDGAASDRGGATYAALDLGTNNCRLLIARPDRRQFSRHRCVLAHHPAGRGRVRPPAGSATRRSARAIDALAICRDKMRNRGVTRARLIATEACRDG